MLQKLSVYRALPRASCQAAARRSLSTLPPHAISDHLIDRSRSMLNVGRSTDKASIRAAYLREAKKFHPDLRGGDPEKFKEIQHAYEVLRACDPAALKHRNNANNLAARYGQRHYQQSPLSRIDDFKKAWHATDGGRRWSWHHRTYVFYFSFLLGSFSMQHPLVWAIVSAPF